MKTLAPLIAVLLLSAAPAQAATRFDTPSHNIGCVISKAGARCDIRERAWRPPPKPRSCPVDWGNGLAVERRGFAYWVCAGDTVLGAGQGARLPQVDHPRLVHLHEQAQRRALRERAHRARLQDRAAHGPLVLRARRGARRARARLLLQMEALDELAEALRARLVERARVGEAGGSLRGRGARAGRARGGGAAGGLAGGAARAGDAAGDRPGAARAAAGRPGGRRGDGQRAGRRVRGAARTARAGGRELRRTRRS